MATINKIYAAEAAAEEMYHRMYNLGATMEDCVNAAQEVYENIAGEKMKDILDFLGIDEEMWNEYRYA